MKYKKVEIWKLNRDKSTAFIQITLSPVEGDLYGHPHITLTMAIPAESMANRLGKTLPQIEEHEPFCGRSTKYAEPCKEQRCAITNEEVQKYLAIEIEE